MTRTRLELVERELTAPPPRKPGAGAAIWQAVLPLLSERPTPISFGRPRRVLDCLRSCEAIESNSRCALSRRVHDTEAHCHRPVAL